MEKYKSLDVVKFICAIFVIAIHTHPLREINGSLDFFLCNILARIAVPFFFMSSGFLFIKKIQVVENRSGYFFSYIKKLMMLYLIWSLVFIYWDLHFKEFFHTNTIKSVLWYFWNSIFVGSHFYLWFIPALIICISILYYSTIIEKINLFLIISIVLYLIGLFGDSYFGMIQNTIIEPIFTKYFHYFSTTRNGLFFGLVFVLLGAKLGTVTKMKKHSLIISTIFFMLLFTEAYLLNRYDIPKDYNLYLFLLPFSYYFFYWLIFSNIKKLKNTQFFRKISMNVYFSHGIFLILIPKIYYKFDWTYNQFILFINVAILSIIFSVLLNRYSGRLREINIKQRG